MKFLVTGGSGFVGSHLADELVLRGHAVHVLDDLSTGSIANIDHLRRSSRFEYTVGSCLDSSLVAELVESVDVVYHLAAAVGVRLVVESPVRVMGTNLYGTETVLRHAAEMGRPVFITSTSEVYGRSTALPYRETSDLVIGPPDRGRWAYACSKAVDEFLALAYHRERDLPVVVGRLFNTAGPRQTGRYGMVIPTFLRQAISERPITVFGDGRQQRCFCHVRDVVRALADLMSSDEHYGEVFNIGSTEEISIAALAGRVKDLSGSHSAIDTIPYEQPYGERFDDMQRRIPDISKIGAAIGWSPSLTLEDILVDVMAVEQAALAA